MSTFKEKCSVPNEGDPPQQVQKRSWNYEPRQRTFKKISWCTYCNVIEHTSSKCPRIKVLERKCLAIFETLTNKQHIK
ncbi:35119_t:CDS:1, partial [Racocetra persica]